jgi:heme-degrading monooxygenase HmoA
VIARIGYFENFDMTDREYVLEAIKDKPGFQGVYHLIDPETGRALSVSFFDSDDDAQTAQRAVGAAREAGGHGGPSPDRVEQWDVVRYLK